MQFTERDEKYMRLALSEAEIALAQGEIPVGCAIVSEEGEVLALTHNECERADDITRHAEIIAISSVKRRDLKGASLYVTLEPCPMCAGAIALSGIKRVIFAGYDKKYGCCGSVYRISEDPAFDNFAKADGGLLRQESEELLRECFERMRKA